jgi:hypothetical protein
MFEKFGIDYAMLMAIIVAAAGAITALLTMIYVILKIRKIVKDGKVTREGIVEAFNTVVTPQKVTVDLSAKIDEKLIGFKEQVSKAVWDAQSEYQEILIILAQVMVNTAAYDKLPREHKARLKQLFQKVKGVETTIQIGG